MRAAASGGEFASLHLERVWMVTKECMISKIGKEVMHFEHYTVVCG